MSVKILYAALFISVSYNIYQNESRVSDRVDILLNDVKIAEQKRLFHVSIADSLSIIKEFYRSKYNDKNKEISEILSDTLKSLSIKGKDEDEKLGIIRSIIHNDTIADD